MIDTGLADKVVLITGANHGIGAATAKAFATQRAMVFINYLRLPALGTAVEDGNNETEDGEMPGLALYNARRAMTADEVVKEIRKWGGTVEAMEADLAEPATIPLLFERAKAAFGRVDILVNNADYGNADSFIPSSLLDGEQHAPAGYAVSAVTAESHDRHFAVNSRAVALMMAEYTRRFVERAGQWGRIINVSTDGADCFPGEISYGASKYAMESYSRSAARELGRFGITVNVVAPGPIQTGWLAPELEGRVIEDIPLGRVGQPEDVADVIVFLASEQARWLTGQILYAGGPKHGYAMIQDIEQFCGTHLEVGTLYGALARLEKEGWIEALEVVERRRPYQLTQLGASVLNEQLSTMRQVVHTGLQRLAAQ